MTVFLILSAIGAVFTLATLAAVVWGLTRSQDRIHMASVCLFACAVLYFIAAVQIYEANVFLGVLAAGYSLVLYVVLAALAFFHKRWALQASVVAFGVHSLLTLGLAFAAFQIGKVAWLALVLWLGLGVVGLYASLHKGSRQFIFGGGASAA